MARHYQLESDLLRQPFLRFALGAARYYTRGYHSVNVLSPCTLPAEGPGILICNHISGFDPVLLQSLCPRLVVWMMAREYYERPGLRYAYGRVEAIPVNRTGRDLAATRMALRALAEGRIVGIFPEGKIADSTEIQPFQTGAAMLAMRSGAPVCPACIEGTLRGRDMATAFALSAQATVAFGNPLYFDTTDPARQNVDDAALKMREAVVALHACIRKGQNSG